MFCIHNKPKFLRAHLGCTGGLKTSTSHKHLFASQCNENQPLLDHQLPSENIIPLFRNFKT